MATICFFDFSGKFHQSEFSNLDEACNIAKAISMTEHVVHVYDDCGELFASYFGEE